MRGPADVATVGVVGGGQLGRMLGLAGVAMGLRMRFLDPAGDAAPAGAVGRVIRGEFSDERMLLEFIRGCDAVTYEFENVPVAAARTAADRVRVAPTPDVLEVAQDRLLEKRYFQSLGIPTGVFEPVGSPEELRGAAERIGVPAVLKTRRLGYDGKGQFVLRSPGDAEAAWAAVGGLPSILEAFVAFDREVSVIAVRGEGGEMDFYPLAENVHRAGILRRSAAPARASEGVRRRAEDAARRVMEGFGYVGVLTIEFFEAGGVLLANEMAPRVHNSGHWTIDGARTSQFENHLRAVLGWPLGPCGLSGGPCEMVNLIGTRADAAMVRKVLALGGRWHWYGKEPRDGRKVGHVTLVGDDAAARAAQVEAIVGA
ncbi:MAG: 5-(carboxyamino)imidazole ribonucleotide synthase [Phycisphaerales bacterium]|nr:5-(carboxyamino)imidazole ribonucleotide synthase [Phycisphaerales bacterium]